MREPSQSSGEWAVQRSPRAWEAALGGPVGPGPVWESNEEGGRLPGQRGSRAGSQ